LSNLSDILSVGSLNDTSFKIKHEKLLNSEGMQKISFFNSKRKSKNGSFFKSNNTDLTLDLNAYDSNMAPTVHVKSSSNVRNKKVSVYSKFRKFEHSSSLERNRQLPGIQYLN
jgi:hypothetical protein